MATHSRHHQRSLLSRVRKWMGLSHRIHKVHHSSVHKQEIKSTDAESPASTTFVELPGRAHTSGSRQARGRIYHRRTKSKRRWIYHVKNWFNKLFAPKPKPKSELFYKLSKDGTYKVIHTKSVTSTGIKEAGLPPQHTGERIHHRSHRQLSGGRYHLRQIVRKFKRLFSGKHSYTLHQRHHAHPLNGTTDIFIPVQQKGEGPRYTNGPKHRHFDYSELVKSWLSLRYLLKLFSSMGLFITAYIITWFTYSFAVMFTASFSEIYGVLYYFEVMWPEESTSPFWKDNAAISIALAGPFISFVMSMVYFALLEKVKNMGPQFKTLVFWLFLLSVAHFLGALVAGAITSEGIGYLMERVQMIFVFRFLISIFCLALIAGLGWKYAGFALDIRPLRKHGQNIPLILINRMALPYLLGTLILISIKIPSIAPQHTDIWVYDVIILTSLLFAIVPPLFNRKLRPVENSQKPVLTHSRSGMAIFALMVSAFIVLFYRLGLSSGLYFYMKFVFHITSF
jgi:hypothetical protein